MRHVVKNETGSSALRREDLDKPHSSPIARERWRSFSSRNKRRLLSTLLNEQYQLCCYAEVRADLRGLGYHIEHVENKSQHPERTFDYQNLAASALDSANGLRQYGKKCFWRPFSRKEQVGGYGKNLSTVIYPIVLVILLTCLMVG